MEITSCVADRVRAYVQQHSNNASRERNMHTSSQGTRTVLSAAAWPRRIGSAAVRKVVSMAEEKDVAHLDLSWNHVDRASAGKPHSGEWAEIDNYCSPSPTVHFASLRCRETRRSTANTRRLPRAKSARECKLSTNILSASSRNFARCVGPRSNRDPQGTCIFVLCCSPFFSCRNPRLALRLLGGVGWPGLSLRQELRGQRRIGGGNHGGRRREHDSQDVGSQRKRHRGHERSACFAFSISPARARQGRLGGKTGVHGL